LGAKVHAKDGRIAFFFEKIFSVSVKTVWLLTPVCARGRPGAAGGPPRAAESIFRQAPAVSEGYTMSKK